MVAMFGNWGVTRPYASPRDRTASASRPVGSAKTWVLRAPPRSRSSLDPRHHDTAAPYASAGSLTTGCWRCPWSPQSVMRNPAAPWARAASTVFRQLVRAFVSRPRMLSQLDVPGATQNGTSAAANAAQRISKGYQSS